MPVLSVITKQDKRGNYLFMYNPSMRGGSYPVTIVITLERVNRVSTPIRGITMVVLSTTVTPVTSVSQIGLHKMII